MNTLIRVCSNPPESREKIWAKSPYGSSESGKANKPVMHNPAFHEVQGKKVARQTESRRKGE
jgi:hypothetical protein